ncbi:hypothetical protein G6F56_008912 [Rhizopus delemar]|nr:hypothetical protein G6F56_008912 [Rhizopus delemar]
MIKWLDVLLDYSFSVIYRKGIDNILPDKLSRLFPPVGHNEDSTNAKQGKRLLSHRKNHAESNSVNKKKKDLSLRLVQRNCYVLSENTQCCALNQPYDNADRQINTIDLAHHDKMVIAQPLDNPTLFYVQSGQSLYADYLIPPESEYQELLEDAHNKVGHYGAEQMVKRLHQEGIHWPKLIDSCVKYVRNCRDCQRHNIQKRGYQPLRPIYSYLPGDHYAIDLGGPITTSSTYNNNYFMVVVCVCTKFCVLRALPDKKSHTVLRALIEIFSTLGMPSVLQFDNGTEFKNSISADLANAMGYEQRFITPLHASANGISERMVQSVKRMLAKNTHGVGNDWDPYLPAIQLALNNRISKKLNSSPFSLMFARKMIEPYGFRTKEDVAKGPDERRPISHEELMKRIDYMTDIVFPAIKEKTLAQVELEQARFNSKHILADYPPGSHVMVRIRDKAGQLAPAYHGPYTVVRKNKGNAYILRDETGVLMPRNYTSIELKLISHDEVIEYDDEGNEIKNYEVEAVIDHRGTPQNREYKVRWKNYSCDWDEWLTADKFNDPNTLRSYWKNLGIEYKPKRNIVITNAPFSNDVLKNNPADSITKMMNEVNDNDYTENHKDISVVNSRPGKRRRTNVASNRVASSSHSSGTRQSQRLKQKRK